MIILLWIITLKNTIPNIEGVCSFDFGILNFFFTSIDLIIIANIYVIGIKNVIGSIHHLNVLAQHSIVRRH
jgi:hypothetical protein